VVHFLDWHYVPPDLCKLDGIDFESNLDTVEKSAWVVAAQWRDWRGAHS
jgi:hypothetical protein